MLIFVVVNSGCAKVGCKELKFLVSPDQTNFWKNSMFFSKTTTTILEDIYSYTHSYSKLFTEKTLKMTSLVIYSNITNT